VSDAKLKAWFEGIYGTGYTAEERASMEAELRDCERRATQLRLTLQDCRVRDARWAAVETFAAQNQG
jgi:hypothetical protein